MVNTIVVSLSVQYYGLATWLTIAHATSSILSGYWGYLIVTNNIAGTTYTPRAFNNYVSKFAPSTLVTEHVRYETKLLC